MAAKISVALIGAGSMGGATGGATGVGQACTRGVVQGSILCMIANFVMTLIFNKLWHLINAPQ